MKDISYNDELLIRYLLGDMTEAEIEQFDELAITNEKFSQHLELVENDLIDDYVHGKLSGNLREKFENTMFMTSLQRDRIDFAVSLRDLTSNELVSRESGRESVSRLKLVWPSFNLSLFSPVTSLVIGIIGLFLSVFLLVERSRLQKFVNEERAAQITKRQGVEEHAIKQGKEPQESLNAIINKDQPNTANKSDSNIEDKPSSKATASKSSKIILAFKPILSSGTNRKQLSLSPSVEVVQVKLEFESDDYATYYIELRTIKKEQKIWEKKGLRARTKGGSKILDIILPSTLFNVGIYELILTGMTSSGKAEELSSYTFDVSKQ